MIHCLEDVEFEQALDYNNYPFDYVLEYIGVKPEEIEDCLKWAFGEDFNKHATFADNDAWNKRHSDICIFTNEFPDETMLVIGKAYLKKRETS